MTEQTLDEQTLDEQWYTISWTNSQGTHFKSVCTYEKLPHYVEVFQIKGVRIEIQ